MKDITEADFSFSPLEKAGTRRFRWKILPQLGSPIESLELASYVKNSVQMVEDQLLEGISFEDEKDFLAWIQESLPLVKWTVPETSPSLLPLLLLCHGSKIQKTEALLRYYIKSQLLRDKEIPILSFQHLYFHFENFPQESLLFIHLQILIEDSLQLGLFKKNLPLLGKEIVQVVKTRYFAHNLLEAKSLSQDFKTTLIHQDLVRLLGKYPHLFDQGVFVDVKRLLALATKEFLESRSPRHLAKIVAANHMTRKIIMRAIGLFPEERHLQLRVAPTKLHFLFGSKSVVGLMITICLRDRYEFFEEKHVLLAVQKIIPAAQIVKGSYYLFQMPQDMIRTLYLEIEKKDAEPISAHEKALLKKVLPNELKASVEKLIPSIFMVRNEEEIMKNILILSQEVKYISDFPQVMISFEQQSVSDLVFTVIMVRPIRKQSKPLDLLFQKIESQVEFTPDRTQTVGHLRKKYPKEASTFRLRIPKDNTLLRADSSVNFYLARQRVIRILQEAVGEVRDYNGGMILQQVEQFSEMKNAFPEISQRYPDLLEDFFYALTPIEMQATLSLTSLHTLFRLMLDGIAADLPKRDSYVLKVEQKRENIFLLLRTKDASYREYVQRALNGLEIYPKSLCSTHVDIQGSYCTGFIYDCSQDHLQGKFIEAVRRGIKAWQEKLSSLKILRLCYLSFPISLDPRIGGDEDSERLLELLFEGLMRMDKYGMPAYAIARSLEVSADHKRYIFKLRDTLWSNGDRVTAHDFEYAWKKILSPNFSTPFAYLFYPIKNAKLAREGKVPVDDVGVRAIDDWTLFVELDHPAPYFLELTAFTLYSPVNHRIDKMHPNWAVEEGKGYVCNGPFQLKKRNSSRGYELVKNSLYWNEKHIEIDQVLITQNNNYTAQQMFKNDEIDWFGRPLNLWDSSSDSGQYEKVETTSIPRIFWYVFNVRRFPFTNPKLRRALAYGVNRAALIKELNYSGSPGITPLPFAHTLLREQGMGIVDGDKEHARTLFEEALLELGIKKADFPVITIIQTAGEIRSKTAHLIKRQWEELFGIHCNIEAHEWSTIFDRLTHGDYQIGGMNWKAWINDPSYTLNAFRYASERVNFAKWENEEYQARLEMADREIDPHNRLNYLKGAEEILLHEMPVIPIYYEVQQFKRKRRLKVDINTQTGHIDFSTARILNN